MMKCSQDYALKTAIELAKLNIQSSERFNKPEEVNHFIEKVFAFLTCDTTKEQS